MTAGGIKNNLKLETTVTASGKRQRRPGDATVKLKCRTLTIRVNVTALIRANFLELFFIVAVDDREVQITARVIDIGIGSVRLEARVDDRRGEREQQ